MFTQIDTAAAAPSDIITTLGGLEDVEVALTVKTDAYSFSRLLAAYETDKQLTEHTFSFNEWVLAVVFDWVSEVEKPTPNRK